MAKLPEVSQPNTAAAILKAYEDLPPDQHRSHLGASLIGQPCARKLWFTFRWADRENHTGRMRRLFETGHLEEPRMVEDLRKIGCQVLPLDPSTGKQWTFRSIGGHFGCSMDAAVLGLPEAPKTWHVVEMKTFSAKNFAKLEKEGLVKAKPEHACQMQVNMGLAGMDRALHLAKNKDNDDLRSERLRFDRVEFERLEARARSIIEAVEPPARLTDDPTRFPCKWSGPNAGQCTFYDICHGTQVPEVNCRTCAHSTPVTTGEGGRWVCSNEHLKSMPELSDALQRKGCSEHRFIPIFLEKTAKPVGYHEGVVIYEGASGTFGNGDGTRGTFTSQEIRTAGAKDALPAMAALKDEFKTAKVVG